MTLGHIAIAILVLTPPTFLVWIDFHSRKIEAQYMAEKMARLDAYRKKMNEKRTERRRKYD